MKSALIIHPDFYDRCDLEDFLNKRSYRVATAKSIRKGLFKLRGQVFRCLIVKAPDQLEYCLALIHEIRKLRPQVPIIFLKREVTEQFAETLSQQPEVYLVLEPFSKIDLLRRLDGLCEQEVSSAPSVNAR
ncbi:MAG: hypothetical protein KDC71_18695 [Acidobacteria bacterium]|nr:hypothetical protein [Acidobacteriota bacterium]